MTIKSQDPRNRGARSPDPRYEEPAPTEAQRLRPSDDELEEADAEEEVVTEENTRRDEEGDGER